LTNTAAASLDAPVLAWPNWHTLLSHHPFLAQLLNRTQIPDRGRSLVGQVCDVSAVPRRCTAKAIYRIAVCRPRSGNGVPFVGGGGVPDVP
jgi:hypothetical protein